MPRPVQRAYSRTSLETGRLFGRLIRLARKQHRLPAQELAERIGISRTTLQRMEKGDLKVEMGLYFEAAVLLGLRLFDTDEVGMRGHRHDLEQRLALLPRHTHRPRDAVDDDF